MHVHVVGMSMSGMSGISMSGRHPAYLAEDLAHVLEQAGHRTTVERLEPHGRMDVSGAAAFPVADLAVTGRPDVVHALDDVAAVAALRARRAGRGAAAPVVVRAEAPHGPLPPRHDAVHRACLRAADAVGAPSAGDLVRALAAGADAARAKLAPDAVALPSRPHARRHGDGPRPATPLAVALTGAAGTGLLLDALRRAPGWVLALAGTSPPDAVRRLQDGIDRLGLRERVRWCGSLPRREAVALAAGADVVVVAGGPRVRATTAVEAMALGLPVLAVDRPGPADAVVHGVTGLVVPADARSLAAALRELGADPFRREAYGEAGLDRFAARYTPDAVARHLLETYRSVVPATAPDATPETPDLREAV